MVLLILVPLDDTVTTPVLEFGALNVPLALPEKDLKPLLVPYVPDQGNPSAVAPLLKVVTPVILPDKVGVRDPPAADAAP